MQLCATGFELGFVGDRAYQRMPKCVLGACAETDLVYQLGGDERSYFRLVDQGGEQVSVEPGTDHCCCVQRSFSGCVEAIDAGADSGMKGRRHIGVGHVAVQRERSRLTVEYAALSQVANYLFGEEGVTACALGH